MAFSIRSSGLAGSLSEKRMYGLGAETPGTLHIGVQGKQGEPGVPGPRGPAGQDGITPTIGENGNWFIGDFDTGLPSKGKDVTEEEIEAAIAKYFEENPPSSGNVSLTGYAKEEWVNQNFQPKGNYLTEHQDISGKLDANKLPEAINTALAEAKTSGAFDGKDGISPKANVTQTANGASIEITDENGTTTATIVNGKDGKDGSSTRNLLDNSDFSNPVNQRGMPSYTGAGYTIDRWNISSGVDSITINEGYIKLSAKSGNNGYFRQYFEKHVLLGKTVTCVFYMRDGTILVGSGKYADSAPNSGETSSTIISTADLNAYIAVTSTRSIFQFRANNGASIELVKVALYEGEYTIDTLPEYQPKGYGAELLECQRYYQVFKSTVAMGITFSESTKVLLPVYPKIPMRVTPSITLDTPTWIRGTGQNVTSIPTYTVNTYCNNSYSPVYEMVFDKAIGITNLSTCAFLCTYALNADL